jgi:hypothetical protein
MKPICLPQTNAASLPALFLPARAGESYFADDPSSGNYAAGVIEKLPVTHISIEPPTI